MAPDSKWAQYDEQRAKHRINLVLSDEERAALVALSEATDESRSEIVGRLVLAEAKKLGKKRG
jgi:uncharacterized protein (DUF1778 family)